MILLVLCINNDDNDNNMDEKIIWLRLMIMVVIVIDKINTQRDIHVNGNDAYDHYNYKYININKIVFHHSQLHTKYVADQFKRMMLEGEIC